MRQHKEEILAVLTSVYGHRDARVWYQRWRIFYMACSELWGYRRGREWGVAHYLFQRREDNVSAPVPRKVPYPETEPA